MQFDTTVNAWHTCPDSGRINASNPCSEYMFLDNSACNLASLNLRKFQREDGALDIEAFRRAVGLLVAGPGDPGRQRQVPHRGDHDQQPQVPAAGAGLRQPRRAADEPGLALRQRRGPGLRGGGDGADARRGQPHLSALIAADRGPFEGYGSNAAPMLGVMDRHRAAPGSDRRGLRALRSDGGDAAGLGRGDRAGDGERLPQRAGDGAGAHGDHRLHDGLRHHGRSSRTSRWSSTRSSWAAGR